MPSSTLKTSRRSTGCCGRIRTYCNKSLLSYGQEPGWCDETADRFDILPLLIATDGAIAAFGHDGRLLRPNIIIGDVDGLAERTWPSLRLHIGDVRIGIEDLRGRCVMTTFDPDTLKQDRGVLKGIAQRFAGKLALNCYVIQGGEIHVGDRVELASDVKDEAIRVGRP